MIESKLEVLEPTGDSIVPIGFSEDLLPKEEEIVEEETHLAASPEPEVSQVTEEIFEESLHSERDETSKEINKEPEEKRSSLKKSNPASEIYNPRSRVANETRNSPASKPKASKDESPPIRRSVERKPSRSTSRDRESKVGVQSKQREKKISGESRRLASRNQKAVNETARSSSREKKASVESRRTTLREKRDADRSKERTERPTRKTGVASSQPLTKSRPEKTNSRKIEKESKNAAETKIGSRDVRQARLQVAI